MVYNLDEYPSTRVTFIDQQNKKYWKQWKRWEDCTDEEKESVNLREIFHDEIILDVEDKKDISEIKQQLNKGGFKYYLYDTGSRGYHIHLYFPELNIHSSEERTKIRKHYIYMFKTDITKASEQTLIALENRPHFKTNKKKLLISEKPGVNTLPLIEDIITPERVQGKFQEVMKNTNQMGFVDYHIKDEFFNYI